MYMIIKDGEFVGGSHGTLEGADLVARDLGTCQVVLVEEVRSYPRLLSEEVRNKLMEKVNLREYASMCICGDGLELDIAEAELRKMDDVEFMQNGFLYEDESFENIREALVEFPELVEAVQARFAELNREEN